MINTAVQKRNMQVTDLLLIVARPDEMLLWKSQRIYHVTKLVKVTFDDLKPMQQASNIEPTL